jgi:uncharacterized protein YecE (DUF72 family)
VTRASRSAPTIAIGTSGWSYRHWRERFYPRDLASSRWLEYYAERFDTVEINATFYRLPTEQAVRRWRDAVPSGFSFAVKGSRLITHARRLQHAEAAVARFVERLSLLGERLGCILWQLPPGFVPDVDVLDRFLGSLPIDARQAVEFRKAGAPDPAILAVLADHAASYVCTSPREAPEECPITSDLVYLRFHGLSGGYAHSYTETELRPWARLLRASRDRGCSALVYFNNDAEAHAPEDATKLWSLV